MRVPVYNLEWAEPPAADDAIKQGILAQLQNNPGKWACITRGRSQTGLAQDWCKLGAEAKAVRNNPGKSPARYDIYARWPANKAATISNAIRAEVAESTASKQPPSAIREATTRGTALVPPAPRPVGGYLAQRAARNIPTDGNPV